MTNTGSTADQRNGRRCVVCDRIVFRYASRPVVEGEKARACINHDCYEKATR